MMTFDTSTLTREPRRIDVSRRDPVETTVVAPATPSSDRASRRILIAAIALVVGFGAGRLASDRSPLPSELLRLAHQTRSGGLFEIEVDAKGRIMGSAAEIDLESVPWICREAADHAFPTGRNVRAEKQTIGSDSYYEIEKDVNGRTVEILMNAKGDIVGEEEEIAPSEAPANVLSKADAALPGGRLLSVERIRGPEARGDHEFHVKKSIQGEIFRIRISDGVVEVLRSIRTALKAER